MSACLFCQIVAGTVPAKKLYEDEHTLAFLDAFPLSEGHTLVVPKTHYELLQDMPTEEAQHLFATLHKLLPKLQQGTRAEAMTVGLNNGEVAGQAVPHVHLHLIPRHPGDGGGSLHAVVHQADQQPVDDVYETLEATLGPGRVGRHR